MNRIVVKLLVAFQLVIVLSIGALILVSLTVRNDPALMRWMVLREDNGILLQIAEGAAFTGTSGNPETLRDYIRTTEQRIGLHLYLINASGQEVTGQTLPPDLPLAPTTRSHNRLLRLWDRILLQRVAILTHTPEGTPLTAIFVNRQLPQNQIMVPLARVSLIVFGQVALSLALTRILTHPILRLRQVARCWAQGDLTARANIASRDEIGELAHEFDEMAARLEANATAQKQLLADISHELRSPLARLAVAVELVRKQTEQSDVGDTIKWERITRETERMNQLIGELLTLSRLEATINPESTLLPVNLSSLLSEVIQDVTFEAEAKHCRLESDLPAIPITLPQGEPELLRRAVENVLRNAVRYTTNGTAVQIHLCREHQEAILTVRDHGPGVPEEALSALFRPFFRVESDRDRASGGVGLGLSITERAIHLHHGSVTAENAPDGGLKVIIRLPLIT